MAKRVSHEEQLVTAEKNIKALSNAMIAKENIIRQINEEKNELRSELNNLILVIGENERLKAELEETLMELAVAQSGKSDWQQLCRGFGDRIGVDIEAHDDPKVIDPLLDVIWENWELRHKSEVIEEQFVLLRGLFVEMMKNK